MSEPATRLVKSAQRVLEVLEYFEIDRTEATVTEVARALHYPQSSTSVLLKCLSQLGYLYYDRFRRTYRPTARVALLGCWAEDGAFRGGKVMAVVDTIVRRFGETVTLSSGVDYVAHHLHAVRGSARDAVSVRVGEVEPLLFSAPGELLLASYPDHLIRLALRRLNAEEPDPEKQVSLSGKFAELQEIRARGWAVKYDGRDDGTGSVAVLMPRRKGGDRIALSIIAKRPTIERYARDFVDAMLAERDLVFAGQQDGQPPVRRGSGGPRTAMARDCQNPSEPSGAAERSRPNLEPMPSR